MTAAVPTLWQRLRYTRLRDVLRGRLDASLDWRLVVTEANLLQEINAAIGQVVRRTRLWHSEKVDVAAELVAHFQDGLDAGRTPEELVKSFGDPQQAARLIRRAKKRGRPLLWHICRYALLVLALLVAAYFVAGLYMLTGRPSIKTDYLTIINERALSVPENERAWPVYRNAFSAMGVDSTLAQQEPWSAYVVAASAKRDDAKWTEAEQFLSKHANSIAKLREAAGRGELGLPATTLPADYSPKDRKIFAVTITPEQVEAAKHPTVQHRWLISTLLPDLQLLRWGASLLANDARRAALAGDGDTALADVIALFGISHHCKEKPFFVSLLVAGAIQRQAIATIQETLTEHPKLWTDAQLRDLAHKIAASQIDWRRGFDGERASFHDIMQRLYTDDGDGDGRLVLRVAEDQNVFELLDSVVHAVSEVNVSPRTLSNDGLAMIMLPAANMVVASRKEMTDVYDRFSDRALQLLDMPLWKANSMDAEIGAFLHGDPLGRFRYLFIELLFPAYDAVRNAIATLDGTRDGVLIGIALELYHRDHEAWPKTLDELSPRWLPELPIDRLTGNPLRYKVVDDRPMVYSVGGDGDDDRGKITVDANGQAMEQGAWPTFVPNAQSSAAYDGDWLIWSTAKTK